MQQKKKKAIIAPLRGSVFSFFSGAGFLDLGFEKRGFSVVFVNELYAPFLDAYKYARQKMRLGDPRYGYHHGDMEDFTRGSGRKRLNSYLSDAKTRGEITGFIGGPPCPDFSIAGKNRGRQGRHGKLSAIYTKLIRQQKPDFFVFENVKGLWKTGTHREFYEELKRQLHVSGYATTERLINALEYGVPQDRDRIILVGFKKNLFSKQKATALLNNSFPWEAGKKFSRSTIENIKKHKTTAGVPDNLTVKFWFEKNQVSIHPNAKHYFHPHVLGKIKSIKEGDVSKKSFKKLHRNCYSPTAAYGNNEVHLHPTDPRRISVAEALAIQSLPRTFSFPQNMTLTDMFKAVGNGVPFIAAKAVAKSVKKFLEEPYINKP